MKFSLQSRLRRHTAHGDTSADVINVMTRRAITAMFPSLDRKSIKLEDLNLTFRYSHVESVATFPTAMLINDYFQLCHRFSSKHNISFIFRQFVYRPLSREGEGGGEQNGINIFIKNAVAQYRL